MKYLFRSENARKEIVKLAQGSTRYNMSKVQFIKIEISIPCIKEQQKIAFCLSALDQLITAQSEKVEQLEQHKKGLMQSLFPKP